MDNDRDIVGLASISSNQLMIDNCRNELINALRREGPQRRFEHFWHPSDFKGP